MGKKKFGLWGTTGDDEVETITVNDIDETVKKIAPKIKKSKKQIETPKAEPPQLARDARQVLLATGKFFGGVAEMKIDKTDLEMSRTQRIILLDKNGKHYEFLRSKPPY